MARRETFEQLLERYEPAIQAVFLEIIDEIRSTAVLRQLQERLERGDIVGAIEVLQIQPEAFGRLELKFAEAFQAGGSNAAGGLALRDAQGNRIAFHFGVRDPESEAWLRNYSATMVTRIVADQLEAIRIALSEGLVRGDNPRATSLNVIGRVSRVTGRREGGIIGLTAPQARYVEAARNELLSANPDQLRNYLNRHRRDKRFDPAVMQAIREGRAVPAAKVAQMVGRYSDKLLALRGEILARTETMTALAKGRDDAMRQAIRSGRVDARFVTKTWRSVGDRHVRHTHQALNGQSVPYSEAFVSTSGARLHFPGDPDAPASETIGCRCVVTYRIDYTGQYLARRQAA